MVTQIKKEKPISIKMNKQTAIWLSQDITQIYANWVLEYAKEKDEVKKETILKVINKYETLKEEIENKINGVKK